MPISRITRPLIRTLFIFLLVAPALLGQNSATTGTLSGVIHDAHGNVIPGAVITVRDTLTNQSRQGTADDDGNYLILSLPVSTYEVGATAKGFATSVVPRVTLTLGQTTTLDLVLQPEGVNASVEVTGRPLTIDSSETASTTSVTQESIEELPVKSRDYLQFTLLAPGVAPSSTRAPNGSGNLSASPLADSGFTFGGIRSRSNSILIDGLSNVDATTGASLIVLSPEIVREFQIVNNGVSAEFGGAAGGTINVLTKTGSNQFHGTAFGFIQNEHLNARYPLDSRRRLYHGYQPGFSIGGPLKKDKLFFYAAAEQEHSIADEEPEIRRSVRTAINTALAAGFAPGLAVRSLAMTLFRTGNDQTEAAGKLTYVINSFNTANLRIAYTNDRSRGDAFNTSIVTDPSARGTVYAKDYQASGSLASVIRSNVVNEARFQFSSRDFTSRAGDTVGPGIQIVGVAEFGRPYDADTDRLERRQELVDTVSFLKGRHEFKAGGSMDHVALKSDLRNGFGGVYVFQTLSDFLSGTPAMWRQAFGDPHTEHSVTRAGAFVQDRWSVTPRLTLNLGVRYDVEKLPAPFATDTGNIAPRLGLAWSPSGKWVVRGGFGLFYDRLPLAFLNPGLQKDGTSAFDQIAYDTAARQIFLTSGGGRLALPVTTIAPSVYRPGTSLHTPYSIQASGGIERQIATDTTIKAEFLYTSGHDLTRTRNVNLLPPTILTPGNAPSLGITNPTAQQIGRPVFGTSRVDPRYDGIYALETSARSTYRGLSLTVNKRFSSEIVALASYTLSKATDDASDFFEQPQNPYYLQAENARSLMDARHRVVISGVFELPFGDEEDKKSGRSSKESFFGELLSDIEVAPIVTLSSGRPVNPLTGLDEERSGAFPVASRPLGLIRNSLSTPSFFNADLRVVKAVRLEETSKLDFAFEFFNVFNHPNVAAINHYFGSGVAALGTFTSPISYNPARQFRFSLDLEF